METNNIVYRHKSGRKPPWKNRLWRWFRNHGLVVTGAIIITSSLGLLCLLVLLPAFQSPKTVNDPVVAQVADTAIHLEEFMSIFRSNYAKLWDLLTPKERETLAIELAHSMIRREILLQEAETSGLLEMTELTRQISRFADVSLADWNERDLQREENVDKKVWKKKVIENIIAMNMKNRIVGTHNLAVSDQEIKAYHDAHRKDFYNEKSTVHLKQLVFENSRTGTRTLKALKQGSSFDDELKKLVERGDESPEIADLGLVEITELGEQETKLIEKAKEKDYIGYQQRDSEYVITQVVEKSMKGYVPFDKVKDRISVILLIEKQNIVFQEWIEKKYKTLPVHLFQEIILQNLTADNVLNRGLSEPVLD